MTVVICAYSERRWASLRAAVASARAQRPVTPSVVLVIDHNDALLGRCVAELPEVTVVPNTRRRGLSGARNCGVDRATGDVVAFLDDDATAEPGWLAALLAPFDRPAVLAVGGSATPVWPSRRPALLPAAGRAAHGELDWVVGCTYTGQPTAAAAVRNVMGCNMSFRRAAVELVGGFDEGLGRIGRTPLGCEETELCIRLRQRLPGAEIVFEPRARVRHRVDPARLTWRYLASRGFAEGVSKAFVARSVGARDALSSERGYVRRVLPEAVLRELGAALGRPAHAASALAIGVVFSCTVAGYARGRLAARVEEAR